MVYALSAMCGMLVFFTLPSDIAGIILLLQLAYNQSLSLLGATELVMLVPCSARYGVLFVMFVVGAAEGAE